MPRKHNNQPDALDEMIIERTIKNPHFPVMLEAAQRRRELLRTLAEKRQEGDLTQRQVAAAMSASQSTLARLESTASDAKLSTLDRFADALGYKIQYRLVRS